MRQQDCLKACKVAVIGHDKVTFTFGEGTSPKLRSLSAGLKLLIHPSSDIRNRDFLTHSFQRKNFIMITHKNPLKKLLLQEKEEDLNLSNVSDIGHAWLRRWVLNRSTRPETIAKLRSFSPENIKDCFLELNLRVKKILTYLLTLKIRFILTRTITTTNIPTLSTVCR